MNLTQRGQRLQASNIDRQTTAVHFCIQSLCNGLPSVSFCDSKSLHNIYYQTLRPEMYTKSYTFSVFDQNL